MLGPKTEEFPDPVDSNRQFDGTITRRVGRRLAIEVPRLGRLEGCLGYKRRPCSRHWGHISQPRVCRASSVLLVYIHVRGQIERPTLRCSCRSILRLLLCKFVFSTSQNLPFDRHHASIKIGEVVVSYYGHLEGMIIISTTVCSWKLPPPRYVDVEGKKVRSVIARLTPAAFDQWPVRPTSPENATLKGCQTRDIAFTSAVEWESVLIRLAMVHDAFRPLER